MIDAKQEEAISAYWETLKTRERVRWFRRAGFSEAYSATTWEVLCEKIPDMAQGIRAEILKNKHVLRAA